MQHLLLQQVLLQLHLGVQQVLLQLHFGVQQVHHLRPMIRNNCDPPF